ncbi:MAG: DUF393 domain-containing protein [Candidatus Peregrinibacteria bacterium]|nr:DUF393 domain-containing protein [Candidatus Peregrinibacteria bacterium]
MTGTPALSSPKSVAVLYDGHCGLCTRSIRVLRSLDWLKHLHLVNFHDDVERRNFAPDLSFEELDRSLHARFRTGKTRTGFDAFRAIAWHLPLLWPVAPFLYLPGIAPIGRRIYARIAERRKTCTHDNCQI